MPHSESAAARGEVNVRQEPVSVALLAGGGITPAPRPSSSQSLKALMAMCVTSFAACGTGNKSGTDSSGFTGTVAIIGVVVSGAATTWALSDDLAYLERDATAIRVALSSGRGAFVTDLAHALRLPERLVPRLSVTLRANRSILSQGLTEAASDMRSRNAFRDRLLGVLAADLELVGYLESARHLQDRRFERSTEPSERVKR